MPNIETLRQAGLAQLILGSARKVDALRIALACVAILVSVGSARADLTPMTGAAVAPNIAEFTISPDGVAVELEIYVEDLRYFEDLLPDDWVPPSAVPRKNQTERMRQFAQETLGIRTGNGDLLPVSMALIEPRHRVDRAPPNAGMIDPITGRVFPKPPDDPRVVYVELFYSFGGTKPDRLEFVPPLDNDGNPFLTIGMIVFDRGVPVTDFRYLSAVARLTLDWDDPWYSKFDNPNLRRHHRYPVMAFLYAEPYEIRHEAVLRVREAAALTGVELRGEYFSKDERDAIASALPMLVNDRSPMTIEGAPVKPDFDRMSYLRVGPSGLIFLEDGEEVRTDAALVGLIYSVPTERFVKQATVEWTLFTPGSEKIPAQTIDAAGPFVMELTPDEPVMVWTNYFKRPPYPEARIVSVERGPDLTALLIALGLASAVFAGVFLWSLLSPQRFSRGRGIVAAAAALILAAAIPATLAMQKRAVLKIADEQLVNLTAGMLNNIYRAFDFRTEDQVYDRLALTLTGTVLEQVFLDQRTALRVEKAGGAQARVESLSVSKVEKLVSPDPNSLRVAVKWEVSGTVGHWGHNHRRNNIYAAELEIRPLNGAWKISGFDILSQERRL